MVPLGPERQRGYVFTRGLPLHLTTGPAPANKPTASLSAVGLLTPDGPGAPAPSAPALIRPCLDVTTDF